MDPTSEGVLSCLTTQLVKISGVNFTTDGAAVQEAFVAVFDKAMTVSMQLLEACIRGFAPEVVVRWGNPELRGQLQIRRGKLEWVE